MPMLESGCTKRIAEYIVVEHYDNYRWAAVCGVSLRREMVMQRSMRGAGEDGAVRMGHFFLST